MLKDDVLHQGPRSPYEEANVFSRYTYSYLDSLLQRGNSETLTMNHLFELCVEDSAARVHAGASSILDRSATGSDVRTSLKKTVGTMVGRLMLLCLVLMMFKTALGLTQIVLLGYLLDRVAADNMTLSGVEVWYLLAGVCICPALALLAQHRSDFLAVKMGLRSKTACLAILYDKCLQLSLPDVKKYLVSHVLPLASGEVDCIEQATGTFLHLCVIPVQGVVVCYLLWREVGLSGLLGMALVVLSLPIKLAVNRICTRFRKVISNVSGGRFAHLTELLLNIRTVKLCALERVLWHKIDALRRGEISKQRAHAILACLSDTLTIVSPCLAALITFAGYSFLESPQHQTPTVSAAVKVLALYALISQPLGTELWSALHHVLRAERSFARIEDILAVKYPSNQLYVTEVSSSDAAVVLDSVTCRWEKDSEQATLYNLSFTCNKGRLLMVAGSQGSGKSSFLMSILGELPISRGEIHVSGSLSYCSQHPWMFDASIQQNILMGSPLDPGKYDRVLKACLLDQELASMEFGDKTLIWGNGVVLSNSMKTRINLARAAYREVDVYLLDDLFGSLDAELGWQIFQSVVCGLLATKTRIVVSHQLQYLDSANEILCLDKGRVVGHGKFADLPKQGVTVSSLLSRDEINVIDTDSAFYTEDSDAFHINLASEAAQRRALSFSSTEIPCGSLKNIPLKEMELGLLKNCQSAFPSDSTPVPLRAYYQHHITGAGLALLLVVLLWVLAQLALVSADMWLIIWMGVPGAVITSDPCKSSLTSVNRTRTLTLIDLSQEYMQRNSCSHAGLVVFISLGLLAGLLVLSRGIVAMEIGVISSRELHNRMLTAFLGAPMHVFTPTFIGGQLERLSKDLEILDNRVSMSCFRSYTVMLEVLAVSTVCVTLSPVLVVLLGIFVISYMLLRNCHVQTSRQFKILRERAQAPWKTHIINSLQGILHIRHNRLQFKAASAEFQRCLDYHGKVVLLDNLISKHLSLRVSILAILFSCSALVLPLVLARFAPFLVPLLEPSLVGLGFLYAINFPRLVELWLHHVDCMDYEMMSVERVMELSNITQEEYRFLEHDLPEDWPKYGIVTSENVHYSTQSSEPAVLKKLRFCVRAAEKVGIVDRDGGNCHSMILLMMLYHGEVRGTLRIDGVDLGKVPLHHLRNKVAMVPQDPVMFRGTLRENLDPFNRHTDADLWDALEEVQVRRSVLQLEEKLTINATAANSRLTTSQRQLLYLARALLHNCKVLLIDEATPTPDMETDDLIQEVVHTKFADSTVLIAARRLQTVMDCQRIMVLDKGRVAEFDEPVVLLQNPSGVFRGLVDQTGQGRAGRLESIAKEANAARRRHTEENPAQYPGCELSGSSVTYDELCRRGEQLVLFESAV